MKHVVPLHNEGLMINNLSQAKLTACPPGDKQQQHELQ
jgi:hypothetical protein